MGLVCRIRNLDFDGECQYQIMSASHLVPTDISARQYSHALSPMQDQCSILPFSLLEVFYPTSSPVSRHHTDRCQPIDDLWLAAAQHLAETHLLPHFNETARRCLHIGLYIVDSILVLLVPW